MEIEDAKKLKVDLEETITKLLQKFSSTTGLEITGITIHYVDYISRGREIFNIEIDTKLS